MDLSKYTDDQLVELMVEIKSECIKRDKQDFSHKVGDCFFKVAPSSMGRGLMICKILHLGTTVECKEINIDACNNSWISKTEYYYKKFTETWKTPISPKVFDLYTEKHNQINDINLEFVNKVIALKDGKHFD